MIHTRNLVKSYRNKLVETPALINVNIDIGDGEFVAIAGPSGSGKSALFNIMGLMDRPDSGEVYFNDIELGSLSEKDRLNLRRGKIGYVFREFNLIDEMTVRENIELPLLYLNLSRKQRSIMVEEALLQFKLGHIRNYYPQQLTGLEQQTTSMARASVFKPLLVLADEPTGDLNSTDGSVIIDLFSEICERGMTVIIFTNSLQDAQKAQRIIKLHDGHVVTESAQMIATRPV